VPRRNSRDLTKEFLDAAEFGWKILQETVATAVVVHQLWNRKPRIVNIYQGVAPMADGNSPARHPTYDKKVGLVLQREGALSSYQAGVL
jgi:hypothetical protein